jgi:hypothetical protein
MTNAGNLTLSNCEREPRISPGVLSLRRSDGGVALDIYLRCSYSLTLPCKVKRQESQVSGPDFADSLLHIDVCLRVDRINFCKMSRHE